MKYSEKEERLNYITHGLGGILSIIGLVVLIIYGVQEDWISLLSFILFGASMIAVYTASTLYHWVTRESLKKKLRLLDHAMIYTLIAGTYSPFLLGNFRPSFGWWMFFVVWGLAIMGIIFKILIRNKMDKYAKLDVWIYIGLGSIAFVTAFFAGEEAFKGIAPVGLCLLVIGGLFYYVGTFFYSSEKIPYNHAIWHLFVIAGSSCHYFSVLYYARLPEIQKGISSFLGFLA